MAYESPTYDKALYEANDHLVMHDRLQIVIQHPYTCPGGGATRDKRKTFHRWPLALEKLHQCGVALTPEQQAQLVTTGKECDSAVR